MLQLADCSLEGLKVLQACNSLRERVPLYYSYWEERIFIIVPRGVDLLIGHGVAVPGNSVRVLHIVCEGYGTGTLRR